MVDQAQPGHGIPSQDPAPGAQETLTPGEAQCGVNSALLGGGLVASAGVAGPVGIVPGAAVGALAGSLGGVALGATVDLAPTLDGVAPDEAFSPVHLHIEDSGGPGRPVVLIHGWPLSTWAWALQVLVLKAAGYRVVAYDRRGFGQSDKRASAYDYGTLADDLQRVMEQCELQDATLVGFSMGGGEVARCVSRFGESRLHSLVFAAAVVPCLLKSAGNPDGPLTPEGAIEKREALLADRKAYFGAFSKAFYLVDGLLEVTDAQPAEAVALCEQSAPHTALACLESFAHTDFRPDLKHITVPTLVIHGEKDAVVPFEGSGLCTHHAVAHSQLVKVNAAPHGLKVSHAQAFNTALLAFLLV